MILVTILTCDMQIRLAAKQLLDTIVVAPAYEWSMNLDAEMLDTPSNMTTLEICGEVCQAEKNLFAVKRKAQLRAKRIEAVENLQKALECK